MSVLFAVASCVSENMTFFPPWRGLAVGCVASPWLSWHSFLGFEAVAVATVAVQTHDFPSQTQQLMQSADLAGMENISSFDWPSFNRRKLICAELSDACVTFCDISFE